MYSEKQVNVALSLHGQQGAITAVIRNLGYPSRTMLYISLDKDKKEIIPVS